MLCGIFVGGRSRRMNGRPKALLRDATDGETLVARAVRVAREAGLEPVLVGDLPVGGALAEELRHVHDAARDHGPLGGLVALLDAAGSDAALALACDMPEVDAALLRRLASSPSPAAALAPRRDGRWEPLCARYDAARVAPVARARLAARELALQGLLDAVGAEAIDVAPSRLDDVDTPDDAARRGLVAPRPFPDPEET